MEQDKYIEQRVDHQIEWYDQKSIGSQRRFKVLRMTEIFLAALIPFLVGLPWEFPVKLVIGALGVSVVCISGLISLNKFEERWIRYRTAAENLKHQKYLFLTKSEPYHDSDAFTVLVKTVESLISQENSNWQNYIAQKSDHHER